MTKKLLLTIGLIIYSTIFSFGTYYTINSVADPGTGVGTAGSLRYCVNTANADASPGPHIIQVSAALSGTVALASAFPAFTRSMILDGRTALGYAPGTPTFIINRNNQQLFTANAAISISIWGFNINSSNGVPINFQNTLSDTIAFNTVRADNNSVVIINNAAAASGYVIQNNIITAGTNTGELAFLTNANNVTITNNTCGHATFRDVVSINGTCSNYIISNNTVSASGNFVVGPTSNITNFTSSNNTVSFSSNFAYNLGTLTTFTISTNAIDRVGTGGAAFSIATANTGSITNNNCTRINEGALFTVTASNVICSNNLFDRLAGGGNYGVRIVAGSNNTVNNNVIRFFNNTGMFLSGTSHTFNGNKITNCSIGLNLSGAISCTGITDTITNHSSYGVLINNGARHNILGGTGLGRCIITNNNADGVRIDGANSNQIINVLSSANNGNGVRIMNSSRLNQVKSSLIGVTASGIVASPNTSNGVFLDGANANNNTIGGTTAADGNVISGNSQVGVFFDNNGPDSTKVLYNYIGVGSNGTTVLVNGTTSGHHAIRFNSGTGAPSLRSVIKNNVIVSPLRGCAISLQASGNDTISDNYMGVDATGLTVVGIGTDLSTPGIYFQQDNSNEYISGNVISCSRGGGIKADGNCSNYIIKGNIIGMNKNGLGTTFGNYGTGIYFSNGTAKTNITIGGTTLADRNIVSKNGMATLYNCTSTDGYGIILEKVNGSVISGNYIGVDATGNVAAGNGGSGIMLNTGCSNITIGGLTVGERNVICDNGKYCGGAPANVRHGIQFNQNAGTNYFVYGNYVGIGADGTTLLGNSEEGVSSYQTPNITIGGNTPAHRNVISGNNKGVYLQPGSATGCVVQGNYIGTDATGFLAKPNNIGVHIQNPPGTIIGGPGAGVGNVISSNTTHGILLENADNTVIQQNYIGVGSNGGFSLPNGGDGIRIKQDGTNGTTGVLVGSATITSLGNIIANNVGNGVMVLDANSLQNQIRRNSIYCNGSARQNGINLNGLGNTNIGISPLVSTSPWITAPAPGITGTFTNQVGLAGTDVIEVFWDNSCGTCQGRTYLGDATSLNSPAAGDWSFSPLPAASDCTPKGGPACLSGVSNITATRTSSVGNTSEFMDCSPIFLPVELLFFTAKKYSLDDVLLEWSTAIEKNNDYFEVLRSSDGNTFFPIAKVNGANNSDLLKEYSIIDENLALGTYYYMLVQVDNDGKQTMSKIITINTGAYSEISIIPTVLNAGEDLKIVNQSGDEILSIAIMDMTGKVLSQRTMIDDVEFKMSTENIPAGLYIVNSNTVNGRTTQKIILY